MQERRKLARWQINRQAKLKLGFASQEIFCRVKDINYKGAQIILSAKLPEDAALKITLRLGEECTIDAEVWVAWRKIIDGVNHYGVYFSKIKDADKDKIYKVINIYYPKDLKQESLPEPVAAEAEKEKGGEEMKDNRIFERFEKQFPARFIGMDSGKEGLAQTFDVSAKGLGLLTDQDLKSHTALEIWLDVPNSKDPLYTRGQVVWSRPEGRDSYRAGIELERADFMGVSRLLRA